MALRDADTAKLKVHLESSHLPPLPFCGCCVLTLSPCLNESIANVYTYVQPQEQTLSVGAPFGHLRSFAALAPGLLAKKNIYEWQEWPSRTKCVVCLRKHGGRMAKPPGGRKENSSSFNCHKYAKSLVVFVPTSPWKI